jgi:hypothetical protein
MTQHAPLSVKVTSKLELKLEIHNGGAVMTSPVLPMA